MIRTLAITEDDDAIREHFSRLLRFHFPEVEVREFESGEAALDALPANPVEIALFDVNLGGLTGIECIRRLRTLAPSIQHIVITIYDDPETIFQALRAGAVSYLLKSTPSDKIREAITEVAAGGAAISSSIARKVIEHFSAEPAPPSAVDQLSRREREILDLLAKGLRYKEIAEQLFVSTETVRTHVRNIYGKLEVGNRQDALKKLGLT